MKYFTDDSSSSHNESNTTDEVLEKQKPVPSGRGYGPCKYRRAPAEQVISMLTKLRHLLVMTQRDHHLILANAKLMRLSLM